MTRRLSSAAGWVGRRRAVVWYRQHADHIDRLLLTLGVAAALIGAYRAGQTAEHADTATTKLAIRTHNALCALSEDYQRRLASSRLLLRANPHGALGFTRPEIEQQIELQQRTLESLREARCR